jgi:hypothetical protein
MRATLNIQLDACYQKFKSMFKEFSILVTDINLGNQILSTWISKCFNFKAKVDEGSFHREVSLFCYLTMA